MRRFLGFIAAIASVPLAILIAFAMLGVTGFATFLDRAWSDWVGSAVIFSIYAVPLALGVGVIVGLPGALIMESAGIRSARAFAALGGLTGIAPFLVFHLIVMAFAREDSAWRALQVAAASAALGAWCGVWAALVYWRIAVRGRRGAEAQRQSF